MQKVVSRKAGEYCCVSERGIIMYLYRCYGRERGKEVKRDVIDCAWGGRYMKGLFLDGVSDTKISRHPPGPALSLSLSPTANLCTKFLISHTFVTAVQ